MEYIYRPKGICARRIKIELNENIIARVEFLGGCDGNLQGISALVEGLSAEHAAERLKGIRCDNRPTSCPDQLAAALLEAIAFKEKGEAV